MQKPNSDKIDSYILSRVKQSPLSPSGEMIVNLYLFFKDIKDEELVEQWMDHYLETRSRGLDNGGFFLSWDKFNPSAKKVYVLVEYNYPPSSSDSDYIFRDSENSF